MFFSDCIDAFEVVHVTDWARTPARKEVSFGPRRGVTMMIRGQRTERVVVQFRGRELVEIVLEGLPEAGRQLLFVILLWPGSLVGRLA